MSDEDAASTGPEAQHGLLEVGVSVALHGDVTFETADRWHEVARSALDAHPTKVTVDLGAVTFLDSSGMYVLVQLRRRASELGVDMAVVNMPSNVELALRTADLLDYLGGASAAS
jgi:stage II sporulation protein AA (anti-sigma F factor antagonist)